MIKVLFICHGNDNILVFETLILYGFAKVETKVYNFMSESRYNKI